MEAETVHFFEMELNNYRFDDDFLLDYQYFINHPGSIIPIVDWVQDLSFKPLLEIILKNKILMKKVLFNVIIK